MPAVEDSCYVFQALATDLRVFGAFAFLGGKIEGNGVFAAIRNNFSGWR